ncbi:hypothetical protein BYT27DRAFT_7301176, partial [Phlegmacium glaucopus]
VTSSICTSVAITATVIRLFLRRRKLWIDDACALLSLLSITAQMGFIINIRPPYFVAYYLIITTFYSTVWFARLSILLTIIRLGPESRSRYLYVAAILFLTLSGVLIGQAFWVCEPQRFQGNSMCKPTKQVAVLKLVSDVIADLFLLVTPLQIFVAIQDKALRFRLTCLFSTCLITTAISLVNASFILSSEGMIVVIIFLLEGSVSLIVANVPVLSNVCFHACRRTPRRVATGEISSGIYFAQNTVAQASVTTLCEICPRQVRTSPVDSMTSEIQGRHHKPESKLDNDKPNANFRV